MWKTAAHIFHQSTESVPLMMKCVGYILLIAFINTMVFPTHSIVHKYVSSASLCGSTPSSANLVEYIVEDYLDVSHPPMDAGETDVHDMEISLEDIDFIHHADILNLQSLKDVSPIYHHYQDYRLFHSCFTRTTPPPES